jgi:beta-carotene hydroxylase
VCKTDQLDRQAVASASHYMGLVAWPTVVLGLLLGLSYVAVVTMGVIGVLSLWLAAPLVAMITYLSYTVLHESVHGSITGNRESLRWLNKALGYMAAWITMIPLTAHRYEHIAHHRYANDEARDPDFHVGTMRDSFIAPLRAALQAWASQFSYYAEHRWHNAPTNEKVQLGLEVSFALAPRLVMVAAGYWAEGLALFVLAWLLGAIVLLYCFAYIVHRPHEQVGRYSDTSTILLPRPIRGPLTWLWMYQNYHAIHHLFPRVPFYKYPDVYRDIEHVIEAKGAPVYRVSVRGLEVVTPKLAA